MATLRGCRWSVDTRSLVSVVHIFFQIFCFVLYIYKLASVDITHQSSVSRAVTQTQCSCLRVMVKLSVIVTNNSEYLSFVPDTGVVTLMT